MSTNTNLQALLSNARLLCLVKFKAVTARQRPPSNAVKNLRKKYRTFFGHCANPKLWKQTIAPDMAKTTRLILAVDTVDPSQTAAFQAAAQNLLDHLEGEVLKDALAAIGRTNTSTWNVKMLNALRITLQQEDDRITFFNNKGHNLDQDATFQDLENNQQELVATYRELLKSNALQATESKVGNVSKRGNLIQAITQLSEFFNKYQKLTNYISRQIDGVTAIPFFAKAPNAENQKTLHALSLTLVQLDQVIARLAADGKDFSQQANFDALSTDQQTLQQNFQKALQCNSITTNDTNVNAIEQIAGTFTGINDLSTLEDQYQALNQLMRSQLSATV